MTDPLLDTPGIDPRIKALFAGVTFAPTPDVPSREALLAAVAAAAARPGERPPSLVTILDAGDYDAIAPADGLDIRRERIMPAAGGSAIELQIITPPGEGPWPCVYYLHGGGMMVMSCFDPNYRAWGRMIARQGVKVVMVDFRNALQPSSVSEVAPYPAGLTDCIAGLAWLAGHAAALDVDPARIVVAGESGGANLALATALSLKRRGELGGIAGLYLCCPYLAGEWAGEEGSSARENAGIVLDVRSNFGAMAYGIEALHARDPLAWPGFATADDLAGLPPVVVTVNEFDPLRDDGVGLYRTLLRVGVPARCRQLMGAVHGTEVYLLPCPDISLDVARDLAAFCTGAGR